LIDFAVQTNEIFLFDFHPLHIALNIKSAEDYAIKKLELAQNMENPWGNGNSGEGVRDFLIARVLLLNAR